MSKQKGWRNLESGQALMEYWPTLPAAIMIIISAGLITNFLRGAFSQTADVLERSSAGIQLEVCNTTEDQIGTDSTVVDNHLIELISTNFDGENTTVVYRVTSAEDADCVEKGNNGVGNGEDPPPPGNNGFNDVEGTSPGNPGAKGGGVDPQADLDTPEATEAIDSWVLGLPQEVADNIISTSETSEWVKNDSETKATGVKFGTTYGNTCETDKQKGNNGVGNGEDGQPPGNPPVNDGEGTSPGNPGNKGGANNDDSGETADESPKGNNGVGNGEDGQPPGEPPVNDGAGTSPGNPGNQGGANVDDSSDTESDSNGNGNGNGNGNDKDNNGQNKKNKTLGRHLVNFYLLQESGSSEINIANGEERTIYMLLSGNYEYAPVTVTTYSNGNTATGEILAPVQVIDLGHTETIISQGCD